MLRPSESSLLRSRCATVNLFHTRSAKPVATPPSRAFSSSVKRSATLIRRPHRPYTFTQLLTLSDGSTTLQRTTSPLPVYRSNKDVRNTPLWNPSNEKMANVEEDEAGRLRAFRRRFGRSWDAESAETAAKNTPKSQHLTTPHSDAETAKRTQSQTKGRLEASGVLGMSRLKGSGEASKASQMVAETGEHERHEDNLMDLISAAGQATSTNSLPDATKKKGARGPAKR